MDDSSAFEDVYVSVPHGGPIYVSDMVGPLTSVSEFRSCLEEELKDLRKELCLDLTEQDRHEISVDELKILSEEELVDIAFQASLKSGHLTRDSSLSSQECSDGTTKCSRTVSTDLSCSVKSGTDEDYVPSNNPLKRSKRTGNKAMMNGNVTKKRKRVRQKDTTDEEDYMVEVEKVAEIKQKQEEDKLAARLHSFSGVSGPVACVTPYSEKKEQMLSFNFTNSSTQKVKSSSTREHRPLHGSDILLCIEVYYINRHATWVKGDCKHIMVIRDMRLVHEDDVQNRGAYPLIVFQSRLRFQKCSCCKIFKAVKVTVDDKWAPENPCYFCGICYYMLHYSNNRLIYDQFKVFDYIHD